MWKIKKTESEKQNEIEFSVVVNNLNEKNRTHAHRGVTQGKINFLLNVGCCCYCYCYCCCCYHTYNMCHKSNGICKYHKYTEYMLLTTTIFSNNKQQTAEPLSGSSAKSSNSITYSRIRKKNKNKMKNQPKVVGSNCVQLDVNIWNESGVCVTVCVSMWVHLLRRLFLAFWATIVLVFMFFLSFFFFLFFSAVATNAVVA